MDRRNLKVECEEQRKKWVKMSSYRDWWEGRLLNADSVIVCPTVRRIYHHRSYLQVFCASRHLSSIITCIDHPMIDERDERCFARKWRRRKKKERIFLVNTKGSQEIFVGFSSSKELNVFQIVQGVFSWSGSHVIIRTHTRTVGTDIEHSQEIISFQCSR